MVYATLPGLGSIPPEGDPTAMGKTSEVTYLDFVAPRSKPAPANARERRGFSLPSFLSWISGERPERRAFRERRATPRFAVEVECEERIGPSRYFRITSDLSTFGLSTRHGWPHDVGTRLQLLIYLPDGNDRPVEVEAEVVGHFNEFGGMRLAFRNPQVDVLRRIHRYLSGQGHATEDRA
jgi:hypothetical protein